jgi:hypothetical protein
LVTDTELSSALSGKQDNLPAQTGKQGKVLKVGSGGLEWAEDVSGAMDISGKADKVNTTADPSAIGQIAIIDSDGGYKKGGAIPNVSGKADDSDVVHKAASANETLGGTYSVTGAISVPTQPMP